MKRKILNCFLCLCFFTGIIVSQTSAYSFVYKTATLKKIYFLGGYYVEYRFEGKVLGKTSKITSGTINIPAPLKPLERVGQLIFGKYVKAGFLIIKQMNLTNQKIKIEVPLGQVGFYWYLEGKGTPVEAAYTPSWNYLFKGRALTPEGIYAIPLSGLTTIGWFLTPSLYWETAVLTGIYNVPNVFLKKTDGWAFYYYPQLLAMIYVPLISAKGVMYTVPASSYLTSLYGFKSGFHDTRFNADTANFLLQVGHAVNEPAYIWAASRYKNYFITHSILYSWYIGKGILVADYSWSGLPKVITHASLNHNLAEVNFLLRLGDYSGVKFAQSILEGIVASKRNWLAKNGDLVYAYYGYHDYHGKDYELLTLNDLVETIKLLSTYGWGKNYSPTIQYLLTAKENFLKK